MALGKKLLWALICAVLLACAGLSQAKKGALARQQGAIVPQEDQKVAELLELQRQSADGVIHFDGQAFSRYSTGRKRPYTLLCFLTAQHLLDKPQLHLRKLRREFAYVVKAFEKEHGHEGKVFFVEMEFGESKEVFHRLSANTLPYIFRLAPSQQVDADGLIKLREDEVMKHDDYGHYPWTAEDMASFLTEKTGLSVGSIERPSLTKSPFFPVIALAVLGAVAYVGYLLVIADFTKNQVLIATGAIVVTWFSVSGGMHNIIRGVPLYYFEKNGVVRYFMEGSQGQLGAEGFIMGTLYTGFGLSTAALIYVAPQIKNQAAQRGLSYTFIVIALICFMRVVANYRWKTGYHWRWYL